MRRRFSRVAKVRWGNTIVRMVVQAYVVHSRSKMGWHIQSDFAFYAEYLPKSAEGYICKMGACVWTDHAKAGPASIARRARRAAHSARCPLIIRVGGESNST